MQFLIKIQATQVSKENTVKRRKGTRTASLKASALILNPVFGLGLKLNISIENPLSQFS